MGWWSDRIGVALPAAIGIVFTAIGTIVAGTSQGFITFLIAHGILMGLLGNSALFVPLLANITHWFDRRRGLAVGIVATGQGVAGTIWIPVFTQVTEAVGWRTTFLYYGVFLACLLPATLILRRRPPDISKLVTASTVPARTVNALGISSSLLVGLLSVAIVGCCISMSIPTVHLVSHVTDLGFTRVQGAEVVALTLACSIVSRLAWGWISDRIGGLLTLFIGSFPGVCCLSICTRSGYCSALPDRNVFRPRLWRYCSGLYDHNAPSATAYKHRHASWYCPVIWNHRHGIWKLDRWSVF